MKLIHELIDPATGRSVTVRAHPVRIDGDETLRAAVADYFAGPVEALTPLRQTTCAGRGTLLQVLHPGDADWFDACLDQASAGLGLRHLRRFGPA